MPVCAGSVLRSEHGRATRFLGVCVDITESRRAKERLEQLRQAQRLESLGRLTAGVAHDFNNILLAIRGYGELALQRLEAGELPKDYVAEVIHGAARGSELTRQLLAFSRRQELNTEVLDLNAVVSDARSLLDRLIGEDVEFHVARAPRPVQVQADRSQLEQVLANLVVNARDAMPGGGRVTVGVEILEEDDTGRQQAVLTVQDTGIGMDRATVGRIFEPFFSTKGDQGTGLGLSTVQGIIEEFGGCMRVVSDPGKGTTFTIVLPMVSAPGGAGPAPTRPADRAETIVLVFGDENVRTIIGAVLERHGFEVFVAGDVEDALAATTGVPVDLILTDMPSTTGRTGTERLSELHECARILYVCVATDEAAVRVGEEEFVEMPFTFEELARRIRDVLDGPA